jgi:alanyl-tRNA synthetase
MTSSDPFFSNASSSAMTTSAIRTSFLEYFRSHGHEVVASSPLVPGNDPTLLFTNAGMVQFKDVFLGADKRSYKRATSSQRCVRAGGKHNDLDQVGYTARHHTFFEMLGNFSFGDYFKRDAIRFAWELLTGVWKLPKERLMVTVYHTDDEAFDIWNKEVGLPADRIVRIGDNKGAPYASDNFWQMADTGPCGPCTEIFYDHGAHIAGGPPGSPDEDGDRFIEIWNLVFMQFDRSADGTLTPLPAPCVDTGMGLERVAAVLQHVHSNYEIDLFQHLIGAAARLTNTDDFANKSLRVIADHIRACSFLIVDGVLPSNEGRGYVLRRIVRRALRHGWMLGTRGTFFWKMVGPLVAQMGDAYPELAAKRATVEAALRAEEERFAETLEGGMRLLEKAFEPARMIVEYFRRTKHPEKTDSAKTGGLLGPEQGVGIRWVLSNGPSDSQPIHVIPLLELGHASLIKNQVPHSIVLIDMDEDSAEGAVLVLQRLLDMGWKLEPVSNWRVLDGQVAFRLYDTYGFPVDLTADIARERGLSIDMAGFESAMDEQRRRARAAGKFASAGVLPADLVASLSPTNFLGYDRLAADNLRIVAILRDGRTVESLADGEEGMLILDRTPFYAESGGQVGDTGELVAGAARFAVRDTVKLAGAFHGHAGKLAGGPLRVGDIVEASVDGARRQAIVLNHSATHLLHAALRKVLGEHVTQKGSLVAPDRLRFDFAHFQPVTHEQLATIETMVNAEIRRNAEAEVHQMGMQEALDFGAMALFGEKYGERVRVLRMGEFSTELCGGTHVHRTGDIGVFKILAEGGVAAGVRRIEALTGQGALDHIAQEEQRLAHIARVLGGNVADAEDKLRQLVDRQKKVERELEQLKAKANAGAANDLAASAQSVGDFKLVAARLEGVDAKALRDSVDQLKQQLGDAVIVLASVVDGRATLIAGVHGKALGKVKAGDILGHIAAQIGGKGGGRPDLAQGGGADGPALVAALEGVRGWVAERAAS